MPSPNIIAPEHHPQHLPGPLPGSLNWHEEQLAQIPRWRLLERYRRTVAMERQRERCLAALDSLREQLLGDP